MNSEAPKMAGKRKRSDDEKFEIEEKKSRLETDTDHLINDTPPTSVGYASSISNSDNLGGGIHSHDQPSAELSRKHAPEIYVNGVQPEVFTVDNKTEVTEIQSTRQDVESIFQEDPASHSSVDFSLDVPRETDAIGVNSIPLKETPVPVELLNSGSETNTLAPLQGIREDEAGNLTKDSSNLHIPVEGSGAINSESETTAAQSLENTKDQIGNLSKSSGQVYIRDEDSSTIRSESETTPSAQSPESTTGQGGKLPKSPDQDYVHDKDSITIISEFETTNSAENKEDEVGNTPLDPIQIQEGEEGSRNSGILSQNGASVNYEICIEREQNDSGYKSVLIAEAVLIDEVASATFSTNQTEASDDVSTSLKQNDDSEDNDKSENKDESEKYLYRLLRPGEDYISGIVPKDIHSTTSVDEHVRRGSSSDVKSKYVSCSKSLDKIKLFAGLIRGGWRHHLRYIVRINCTLIGSDVEEIDLTDTTIREKHSLSQKSIRHCMRFSEVLLAPKSCIPAASIRKIGKVQNDCIDMDE